MAEDDIYGSKAQYERLRSRIDSYTKQPDNSKDAPLTERRREYWIKNAKNLRYYHKLIDRGGIFDARDTSFVRRLRLLRTLQMVTHILEIDLKDADRDDLNRVIAFSNERNKTPDSRRPFIGDIKFLWRHLLPDKDRDGRPDETIVPYPVRHLSARQDRSHQKERADKFTDGNEIERLVAGFSHDPRMAALIAVTYETLARPQEILGRNIGDVTLHDNYAVIRISQHGKEGIGILGVDESYFYLSRWMDAHPFKHDKDAPLFITMSKPTRGQRLTPTTANKLIKDKLRALKINKPITLYSLKRNSVTELRMRGVSDVEIQHRARWTTTRQLHVYDMSAQEEVFTRRLVERGKIKAPKGMKKYAPKTKLCLFCQHENGMAATTCDNCHRPLDREAIETAEKNRDTELAELRKDVTEMKKLFKAKEQERAVEEKRRKA
ncbi:MAG: tyrosine-type recombinase/integrase [Nanoarchaeota archaeon]